LELAFTTAVDIPSVDNSHLFDGWMKETGKEKDKKKGMNRLSSAAAAP
jgi:hypothetical protein